MNGSFSRSLERLLHGAGHTAAPVRKASQPKPAPHTGETLDSRHRKWFAQFARDRVMLLLNHTVAALQARQIAARCRLIEEPDEVVAELVITPPGLPAGAHPPRFTIAAAPGTRGLVVDSTGTFPNAGAAGGFGAEIVYDTIYTSELGEYLVDFVRRATGA